MPFLTVDRGPLAGQRFELNRPEYVVGRNPDCDIAITIRHVSNHHCKIAREGNRYWLEDLKSRAKTFLNGVAIDRRMPLESGDSIGVCETDFTFHDDAASSCAVMVDDVSSDSEGSTIKSKVDVHSSIHAPLSASTAEVRLKVLIEFSHSLSQALSLETMLPQVLESLFRIFAQADRGFIGMLDEEGELVPRSSQLRRQDMRDTIRVSKTIAKLVMEKKEAMLFAKAPDAMESGASLGLADLSNRSMMCAPLIDSERQSYGILQIDTLDQRRRFSDKDLEIFVSMASQAALAINNTKRHEDSSQQREFARDLQLARKVQHAFLPQQAPVLPTYSFFSHYRAANQVGGDYYDYVPLADGRLAVIVADVVGKGVAAAMLMAKLSAEARFCLASHPRPADAITHLNNRLCQLNVDRFVTLVMVVLDPQSHEATIVNAGHWAPLYRHVEGRVEEPGLQQSGIPLGIIEGNEYQQLTIQLASGDLLTLYTDGINEATNEAREQYSVARLTAQIAAADGSPQATGEAIIQDVQKHIAKCPQHDDMCLVVLRRD